MPDMSDKEDTLLVQLTSYECGIILGAFSILMKAFKIDPQTVRLGLMIELGEVVEPQDVIDFTKKLLDLMEAQGKG